MAKSSDPKISLRDQDKVVVVGGGPSGAFFAIHLLREARRLDRTLDVTIIEKKKRLEPEGDQWGCDGCNFGAGGISPRLNEILEQSNIAVPPDIIRGEINKIWIHGLWKNFPLKVPQGKRMYSVFRGSLPPKLRKTHSGFDAFLLGKAVREGAQILSGEVRELSCTDSGFPMLKTRLQTGELVSVQAGFVAISTGVNIERGKDYRDSDIIHSIRKLNPKFVPAQLRKTFIFELEAGRGYLEKNMNNEAYFIEYGSKELPLEHLALIPKGDFLTLALIGKCVDKASLPQDTMKLVGKTLALPQIRRILPNISSDSIACACYPMMTVKAAKNPYANRLALVGDAVGSRLYKDGLYSAYVTAQQLAGTVVSIGIDAGSLAKGYGKSIRWLSRDNLFGRMVFGVIRLTFSTPILSRVIYQAFATELKIKDKSKRPLGEVLWKIASGIADYRHILRKMFSFPVFRSTLLGVLVTSRNMLTELLLGLKWGKYGRYPTVIVREKRGYIRDSVSLNSEIDLDASPDFERMYAIKIKASAQRIYEELGKFGDERRNYLNLRFFAVVRVSGSPNELGSIVSYKIRCLPLSVDLNLSRSIPNKMLLYEVSEMFARRGELIFEIKPTKDGNNRLVIYTAFDFKKGKFPVTRITWWFFRIFFPSYIHDVVWNHALCTIKEDCERFEEDVTAP